MIASGYTLDLYCDMPVFGGCQRGEYFAEEGKDDRNAARKDGWKFCFKTNTAICPKCAKEGATFKDAKPKI